MRTVCPSCQSAYDVPAAVLATGRTLRCARCGADFTPEGAAPAVAPVLVRPAVAAPQPATAPMDVLPAEREPVQRSGPRPAVMAGWAASLVVLIAMGWGFVAWRGPIERVWPASERIYVVLGFR